MKIQEFSQYKTVKADTDHYKLYINSSKKRKTEKEDSIISTILATAKNLDR